MNNTILHLIERSARHAPDRPAILTPEATPLSYASLLHQVQTTARALQDCGVGPGDRVAVVLPNGPTMATCVMGVASAATCAPLNPACRAEEFDFYLGDLHAKALVLLAGARNPAREVAERRQIPVIELVSDAGSLAGRFTLSLPVPVAHASADHSPRLQGPDDVALVLHTSGTTSRPKLVSLTQANLVASADNIQAALQLTPEDRGLNVMPLFHIHGLVGALLSSIAAGGQVVCTPGFEAPAFIGWLTQFRPTWYTAVPTMHQAILARVRESEGGAPELALRFIRSSSGALTPGVMTELEQTFGVPVIESYGMTEAAHQMASNPLPPNNLKPGSVGRAAGPEIAVMGEDGRLLADGETGRSRSVART